MSPASRHPRLRLASDSSLLVTFADEIALASHQDVLRLLTRLLVAPHPAIRNLHPAYGSLLVSFDPLAAQPAAIEAFVQTQIAELDAVQLPAKRTVEIPVCYDPEFGLDLEFVATQHGLDAEAVVQLHASVEYVVYFIGFSPGFPYLGELPAALATPRLASPRRHVAAGSVAIGGSQTGIYPLASPGGWRILGRTPLVLFDPRRDPPALLQMGDRVRFLPITRATFDTTLERSRA